MYKDKIIYLIEKLRKELNNLLEKEGNVNQEVLKKSRELDEVLNKYYKRFM